MEFFPGLSKDALIMTLFGGVFVLIGFGFLYFTVSNIHKDIVSKNWPKAFGELKDIEITKHVREDREKPHRTIVRYTYTLTYKYEVNRTPYEVKHSDGFGSREAAVAASKRHHIGESLSVYYNPGKPEQSRAHLVSAWRNWVWVVGTLAFWGFGGSIIYIGHNFFD